jgi:hypothetical protein
MGKASTRGRAPGRGGKAEVWKKADEDEALMLSDSTISIGATDLLKALC